MASDRQVLRSERGVVLTQVTLRGAAFASSTAFAVSSKRTPEVQNFDTRELAEDYFREELKRSEAAPRS